MGTNTEPSDEASASADPEIPPKKVLDNTFTSARPPLTFPMTTLARSINLLEIPPSFIISPARIKKGIANKEKEFNPRSEEHTSELQSRGHLVCRLLLEKKKTIIK